MDPSLEFYWPYEEENQASRILEKRSRRRGAAFKTKLNTKVK